MNVIEVKSIKRVRLLYDGECPFCRRYVRLLRLKRQVEQLELLNGREHPDLVEQFRLQGRDVNAGMIAVIDREVYHGDEAMTVLAALGTRSDVFNRVNARIFKSPALASVLYPLLMALRRLLLLAMRRKLIP